jgi:hypothetical protein
MESGECIAVHLVLAEHNKSCQFPSTKGTSFKFSYRTPSYEMIPLNRPWFLYT